MKKNISLHKESIKMKNKGEKKAKEIIKIEE